MNQTTESKGEKHRTQKEWEPTCRRVLALREQGLTHAKIREYLAEGKDGQAPISIPQSTYEQRVWKYALKLFLEELDRSSLTATFVMERMALFREAKARSARDPDNAQKAQVASDVLNKGVSEAQSLGVAVKEADKLQVEQRKIVFIVEQEKEEPVVLEVPKEGEQ